MSTDEAAQRPANANPAPDDAARRIRECLAAWDAYMDEAIDSGLPFGATPWVVVGTADLRALLAERDAALLARINDRDALGAKLHSIICGWNCPGHGVMQPIQDEKYRKAADAFVAYLSGASEGEKP